LSPERSFFTFSELNKLDFAHKHNTRLSFIPRKNECGPEIKSALLGALLFAPEGWSAAFGGCVLGTAAFLFLVGLFAFHAVSIHAAPAGVNTFINWDYGLLPKHFCCPLWFSTRFVAYLTREVRWIFRVCCVLCWPPVAGEFGSLTSGFSFEAQNILLLQLEGQ